MIAPVVVIVGSPVAVAMPKSVRQARPSEATSTLAGLTSRCTTPAACAAVSPASTSSPMRATAGQGSGPWPSTTCWRLQDSTSSITSQGRPSSSTTS
jgi:hypothetical protein